MSLTAAAEFLGMSAPTLYYRARTGRVPFKRKPARFLAEDVIRYRDTMEPVRRVPGRPPGPRRRLAQFMESLNA